MRSATYTAFGLVLWTASLVGGSMVSIDSPDGGSNPPAPRLHFGQLLTVALADQAMPTPGQSDPAISDPSAPLLPSHHDLASAIRRSNGPPRAPSPSADCSIAQANPANHSSAGELLPEMPVITSVLREQLARAVASSHASSATSQVGLELAGQPAALLLARDGEAPGMEPTCREGDLLVGLIRSPSTKAAAASAR